MFEFITADPSEDGSGYVLRFTPTAARLFLLAAQAPVCSAPAPAGVTIDGDPLDVWEAEALADEVAVQVASALEDEAASLARLLASGVSSGRLRKRVTVSVTRDQLLMLVRLAARMRTASVTPTDVGVSQPAVFVDGNDEAVEELAADPLRLFFAYSGAELMSAL